MTRAQAFPFLRAGQARVVGSAWQVRTAGDSGPLPALLPHWDYNTDLQIARTLTLDEAGLRADCGLGPDAALDVVAVWRSSGTALRGRGDALPLGPARHNSEYVLSVRIPGRLLAVDVMVATQVVLRDAGRRPERIAARVPGTVLWEDRTTVTLEGTASRFPMEVLDFEDATWLPYKAAWYLSWNVQALHQPFLRNVRLFVNAAHDPVVAAVQAADPTPQQRAVQSAVLFDVGRQLIRGALASDDFLADAESYAEGSTGHAVFAMIRTYLPGERLPALRSTLERRPEFFESMLQGAFGLFAEQG